MTTYSDIQKYRRRRDIDEVLEAGGCVLDLAQRWGCTSAACVQWMDRNSVDPMTRRGLAENGVARRIAKARAHYGVEPIERMRFVQARLAQGDSKRQIAKALKISPPTLKNWLDRHAPDSLEQAIEDLSEEAA